MCVYCSIQIYAKIVEIFFHALPKIARGWTEILAKHTAGFFQVAAHTCSV